jgi:predicted nucleic acid-binding protein
MAKVAVLVDTDVFIDYFNHGRLSTLFDSRDFTIYYSIVTKKELLSKPGLRDAERHAIVGELRRFRVVKLTNAIASRYSDLRRVYPRLAKEDALIAATALTKRCPLVTRNQRHFRPIHGLILLGPR